MSLKVVRLLIGTISIGSMAGGSYLLYDHFSTNRNVIFSQNTLGEELFSEGFENKLLTDDAKLQKVLDKYKIEVQKLESKKIKDFDVNNVSLQNFKNKCKELWESPKEDSEKETKKQNLKDWCLENSSI